MEEELAKAQLEKALNEAAKFKAEEKKINQETYDLSPSSPAWIRKTILSLLTIAAATWGYWSIVVENQTGKFDLVKAELTAEANEKSRQAIRLKEQLEDKKKELDAFELKNLKEKAGLKKEYESNNATIMQKLSTARGTHYLIVLYGRFDG